MKAFRASLVSSARPMHKRVDLEFDRSRFLSWWGQLLSDCCPILVWWVSPRHGEVLKFLDLGLESRGFLLRELALAACLVEFRGPRLGAMPSSQAQALPGSTVSFHNFKSQNFKLSVSNPKSKYVAYVSVPSRISNCQGLGRKNKHEFLKTDRMLADSRARAARVLWCKCKGCTAEKIQSFLLVVLSSGAIRALAPTYPCSPCARICQHGFCQRGFSTSTSRL